MLASEPVELADGEALVTVVMTNMLQGKKGFGGRLTVTDRRLVFHPVELSSANGGRVWECSLGDVVNVDIAKREWTGEGGALRRRVRVAMRSGGNALFVVWRPRKVSAVIREQVQRIRGYDIS